MLALFFWPSFFFLLICGLFYNQELVRQDKVKAEYYLMRK